MYRSIIALVVVFGIVQPALSQDADKTRAQMQAAGQAAEADRLFKLGEWEPAMALYEAERASRAALGDLRYEAYANRAIGICRAELGDDEGAIEAFHRARVLDIKREDKGYAGYDLFHIAKAQHRLNRQLDAIKTLNEAIPLLSTAVDRDHEADARLYLALILLNLGRAEEARPHVARGILLAEELKDQARLADSWALSGQIEGSLGNFSLALERFADAQELFEQDGRAAESAWMEMITASTLVPLGRLDLALNHFTEAARRHEHLEDFGSLAEDLSAISGLQLEANQLDEALASAKLAVEKAESVDDRPREIEARVRLSQVQGRKGDWISAAETLEEAVLLVRQVAHDEPAEQLRVILTAALTEARADHPEKARVLYEQAHRIAVESRQAALQQVVADAMRDDEKSRKDVAPPKPRGEKPE